jgi:hypothetical protein
MLAMLEFKFHRHPDLPGSKPDWAFARNRLAAFLPFVHPNLREEWGWSQRPGKTDF